MGKIVHSLLEQFYRHRQLGATLGADELARRLANQWGQVAVDERVAFRSAAQEDACRQLVLSLVVLFTVGAARARVGTGSWWANGVEMLGLGVIVGGVAYYAGAVVSALVENR